MRGIHALLFLVLCAPVASGATHDHPARVEADQRPAGQLSLDFDSVWLSASTTSAVPMARETTGPDTFVLYGGPDRPLEGKFEDASGRASWNGWVSYDATDVAPRWHVSTFNAENLGAGTDGNLAMWCGQDFSDQPGWATPPGYGNSWFEVLLYESGPVADVGQGQTVDLDFVLHHDLEPWYDFFFVEYDSAGTWTLVGGATGSTADPSGNFNAPGLSYTQTAFHDIVYTGDDYGGDGGDRIRIRLRVDSDGGWSDEDGLYDSAAGAVQLDDIVLTTSEGTSFEDFEGPGPYLFVPQRAWFAGDFAELYSGFQDIDPCRANQTPMAGFIDYGQQVRNGPGVNGLTSTGGSTSPGITYGIPGNWVTNYTGGLTLGAVSIHNGITSPEIWWDLPGPEDDDPAIAGLEVRFDVWQDLPLLNGIAFGFEIRGAGPGEPFVNDWAWNRGWYLSSAPTWKTRTFEAASLVEPGVERIQIRLFAIDVAWLFGLPGAAGTPSPVFDNVAVTKYRLDGVVLQAQADRLLHDGFPASGSVDASSPAARDALDVPLDMAKDIDSGDLFIVPGDSMVVTATPLIPGTDLADLRLFWALKKNPFFEDALRQAPSGSRHVNVDTSDPLVWTGEVLADTCHFASGAIVEDAYFFDLPDQDFLYPGDVLQYYLRAQDSDGRVSTLPRDLSGFGQFDRMYTQRGTVRALPTLSDAAGDHPGLLVVVDRAQEDRFPELMTSLTELGMVEGVDYDVYWKRGANLGDWVSNGIGSAGGHGANANQLDGYTSILYFTGSTAGYTICDGTRESGSKSNDIAVLEDWHRLPGHRNMAYFGDRLAEMLSRTPAGVSYLQDTIGATYEASDVVPWIGGQVTPVVRPALGEFATEYVLDFNCKRDESDPGNIRVLPHNYVEPGGLAVAGHEFLDASTGLPIRGPAASTVMASHQPGVDGYDVLVPSSLSWIYPMTGRTTGVSERTRLLQEVLALFDAGGVAPPAVSAPERPAWSLQVSPNPFNARTVVRFEVPDGARGKVLLYNLRGELVRTLHEGEYRSTEFVWDGVDDRGAAVASGVYLVRATGDEQTRIAKIALVR